MDRRTEIARDPDIDQTPRTVMAAEAGEKLRKQSVGGTFAKMYDCVVTEGNFIPLGERILSIADVDSVPDRAEIRQDMADSGEINLDGIYAPEVGERQRELIIKTLTEQETDELISEFSDG